MKTSTLRLFTSLLVLWVGLGAASWADTLDYWINPNGGNWSTASNWSDGVVPNNGNGIIYSVTLPTYQISGYSVALDMSATIGSLTLDSTHGCCGNVLHVGSPFGLTVTGDINNYGDVVIDGTLTATHYVGSNEYGFYESQLFINPGGTMNVSDAIQSQGQFAVNNGTLNGNLEAGTVGYVDVVLGTNYGMGGSATVNGNLQMDSGRLWTTSFGQSFVRINGNLTMTPESEWETALSDDPNAVKVSGDASLAGTAILEFVCCNVHFHNGERFDIMTYQAETGQFSDVVVQGLVGETVTLDYGPTALEAVVSEVPEPTSLLLMSTGLLALAYHCRRRFTAM